MIAAFQTYGGWIGVALVSIGVICILYTYAPGWWHQHMKARHARFVAAQGESNREIALKLKLQNIIRTGLIAAVDAQEISQKEEHKLVDWIKVQLGMPDLRAGRTQKEIKERLKADKAERFNKSVHGFKAGQ